jgi:hypothetical protein
MNDERGGYGQMPVTVLGSIGHVALGVDVVL